MSQSNQDHYNKAVELCKQECYNEAIQGLTRAIEIDQQYADAYIYRGFAYYQIEKYEEAFQDYKKAIQINPLYIDESMNTKTNKLDLAIRNFTISIKILPKFATLHYNSGAANYAINKYEEAIKDYTNAYFINFLYVDAYTNSGNAYKAMNKYEDAIKIYTAAIEVHQRQATAYYNRGVAYYAMNKYDQAIQDYENAIRTNLNYMYSEKNIYYRTCGLDEADEYYNQGNAYFGLNKYDQAIQNYKKAIQIQSNKPIYHAQIGLLYYILKQFPKSHEHLQKAQELSQNLTQKDLQSFNISQRNLNFINEEINLLTEIDLELQKIKDKMTTLQIEKSISLEEEQNMSQKINRFEDQIQKAVKQNQWGDSPSNQTSIIQMFQVLKQQMFDEFKQYKQNIESNLTQQDQDIQQIKQQDSFVIQQELAILNQPNNINQYLYYKSLFWRLYNYLHAMSLISTDLFFVNKDSMIESSPEKVFEIVQKSVKVGTFISESVSVVGQTVVIINKVLDFWTEEYKEQKFKGRMISFNSILKQFAVTPTELEREIQFGAFDLIKTQKFNFQEEENERLQQYINELSNLESIFEKQSQNIYWKLGIKHSIIILNYLETNHQKILNQATTMKLRDFILDSIMNYNSKQQQGNIPKEKNLVKVENTNTSCSCEIF